MASPVENENQPENQEQVPPITQLAAEHSEASQVLETMRHLIVEIQSYKADNEQLKRAQEKQQEINEILLQSLQEKNNGKEPRTETRKGPEREESAEGKDSSSNETQNSEIQAKTIGKRKVDHLEGEFKKIKPTSFDGESKTGEEAEAWLLDIKKYFHIYNYSSNMKVRMAIYNLKGKASIWWQDLKISQGLKEKTMEWEEFKRLFKKQYLSENYYERKTKEFYELRLGSMNMEELINKFLDLLRFVPYIKEENVKVQRFLSCLPQAYKDRIEFDNPKTLDEALRKARLCYEQYKQRNDSFRTWKDRKPERFSQQKRGSRPSPHKNNQRNTPGGPYTKSGPPPPRYAKPASLGVKGTEGAPRGPLTCWECDGPHLKRHCPCLTGASNTLHSIQEASTVGDIGRSFHCINAALEDRQADHQSTIVEIEGIVSNHAISVLIDPGATLSYISPRTVELCQLVREKHVRP